VAQTGCSPQRSAESSSAEGLAIALPAAIAAPAVSRPSWWRAHIVVGRASGARAVLTA